MKSESKNPAGCLRNRIFLSENSFHSVWNILQRCILKKKTENNSISLSFCNLHYVLHNVTFMGNVVQQTNDKATGLFFYGTSELKAENFETSLEKDP